MKLYTAYQRIKKDRERWCISWVALLLNTYIIHTFWDKMVSVKSRNWHPFTKSCGCVIQKSWLVPMYDEGGMCLSLQKNITWIACISITHTFMSSISINGLNKGRPFMRSWYGAGWKMAWFSCPAWALNVIMPWWRSSYDADGSGWTEDVDVIGVCGARFKNGGKFWDGCHSGSLRPSRQPPAATSVISMMIFPMEKWIHDGAFWWISSHYVSLCQ